MKNKYRMTPDIPAGILTPEKVETRLGSASEAMPEAMKLAILEVNGAVVETASLSMKFGLDVTDGQDTASLRGSA